MKEKHPEYQYLDLLREVLERGKVQTDKGTGVKTYSVFGRQIRFDLSKGFPLLTTKKVYWHGILHELYWFLSGQSNIEYLVKNKVHIWDDYPYKLYKAKSDNGKIPPLTKEAFIEKIGTNEKFAKRYGELKHIYGEMWRHWPTKDKKRTVDQLQWALNEVTEDPDCHNAIVSSWNPEYLYAMAKPGEACRFPICHNMYQLNVKEGKLCLQLYQRSADIFLGVPFNIASYALLTHILAKIAGYKIGEYIHTFGDLHIYENHIKQAKEQLSRVPKPFPTVRIDTSATTLKNFRPKHVMLENYNPHSPIKAELTIAGGFVERVKKK